MRTLTLTADELTLLQRPIKGDGGWQRLQRRLKNQLQDGKLLLTDQDVNDIRRYKQYGGNGGWQQRLKPLA